MIMQENQNPTRRKIVAAAEKLFYAEGIGRVSVDAVAEKAGVTKRTLYYHFTSKDELIEAYLAARDQPNLALFRSWFEAAEGGLADKTKAIFTHLAHAARHPRWQGCGFLRTSVELVATPGHPALKVGAAHKKKFEAWMAMTFASAGIASAEPLAQQVLLLLDGAFAVTLLQRDPAYMEAAGDAARVLVGTALRQVRAKRTPEESAQLKLEFDENEDI